MFWFQKYKSRVAPHPIKYSRISPTITSHQLTEPSTLPSINSHKIRVLNTYAHTAHSISTTLPCIMSSSVFAILLLALVCTPYRVAASKTCRSVCSGATDAVLCTGGCAVTTGVCKANDVACKAACAFAFGKRRRRKCMRNCRRKTVDKCKRRLVSQCKEKCRRTVVAPCERGCRSALPKVCRAIMSAVPRNVLIDAANSKAACRTSHAVVTSIAAGVGPTVGLTVGPKGAIAGAVVAGSVSASYLPACNAVRDAKTDRQFKDRVCKHMGF